MVIFTSLTPSGRLIGLEHISLNDAEVAYLKKSYCVNLVATYDFDHSAASLAIKKQLESKGLGKRDDSGWSLSPIGILYYEQHYLPFQERFYSNNLVLILKEMVDRFDASSDNSIDVSDIPREKFDNFYMPLIGLLKEIHFISFGRHSYSYPSFFYQITDRARKYLYEIKIYEEAEALLSSIHIDVALKEDIISNYKNMKEAEMGGDFKQAIISMNDVLEKVIKVKFGFDAKTSYSSAIGKLKSDGKITDFEMREMYNINDIRNTRHMPKDCCDYVQDNRYYAYQDFFTKLLKKIIS